MNKKITIVLLILTAIALIGVQEAFALNHVGGSISGFKIEDTNGNGIRDAGEKGLQNWTITLTGIVGTGIDTKTIKEETTTDAQGFYRFDNLPAGRYILTETLKEGFVPIGSLVKNIELAKDQNSVDNNFFNRPIQAAYTQTNLVSDIPGLAEFTDPDLINSWGITHSATSPWWVADNGMGLATLYNGSGVKSSLVVTIPGIGNSNSTPTGIVFNGGTDFNITPGSPARFIFVTEDGTIAAWNPSQGTNAVIMVNNSPDAVYKGTNIAENKGKNLLYVANFRGGTIDVFDTNFNKVNFDGKFTDPKIPAGFAPFNVMNIGGNLVVTFAKQDALKHDDVAGPGNGFVDIFDPAGNLIMRLMHGFWLNSPWGVAKAPADFGQFSNHLLVGNFGSGMIAGFDDKGNFHGFLRDDKGKPITIDGLWGLGFGNDANAGPSNTLFFAAGINDEQDGLFGTITN